MRVDFDECVAGPLDAGELTCLDVLVKRQLAASIGHLLGSERTHIAENQLVARRLRGKERCGLARRVAKQERTELLQHYGRRSQHHHEHLRARNASIEEM